MRFLLWFAVACSGPSAPVAPVREPAGPAGPAGPAAPAAAAKGDAGPTPVDATSLRALVERTDKLLTVCTGDVWEKAANPADAERVSASCGGLGTEADEAIRSELGRIVEGDAFVANLSHAADDIDQLVRTLKTPEHAGELQNQIDHVRGSIEALKSNVAKIRGIEALHPVESGPTSCLAEAKAAEVVQRLVDGQKSRFENLDRLLIAFGTKQANKAELVRKRVLLANQRAARLRWEADTRRWAPACAKEPGAQPWVDRAKGALAAAGPALDAFDAAVGPLVAGAVTSAEEGERLQQSYETARAGWVATWAP